MKKFAIDTGIFLLLIFGLLLSLFTTIDYTPYQEMAYYSEWKEQLEKTDFELNSSEDSLKIGWAKINFTPDHPVPLAGYGVRKGKPFDAVHDSVYVRTILLEKGDKMVALVSADLLIIPPTVRDLVSSEIKNNISIYYGATHSHNSIGGWYNTLVGKLFAGKYDEGVEKSIAKAVLSSVDLAAQKLETGSMLFEKDFDDQHIRNRLIEDEPVSPFIRSISFKTGSKTAILTTYAAHSTVLDSKTNELSRDYPGVLVDSLENSYDFAMFMAGAVGSMGPIEIGQNDFEQIENQGYGVLKEVLSKNEDEALIQTETLKFTSLSLPLRKPSPRVGTKWVMRPWVFNWLFGNSANYINSLKIGNLLMIGLPCDFSGELMEDLDNYAESKGLKLIITSFNGGYAGYITKDDRFSINTYETTTMNWFGPYNGQYFSEIVRDIIDKSAD